MLLNTTPSYQVAELWFSLRVREGGILWYPSHLVLESPKGVGNAGTVRDTHTHPYEKKTQRQAQWQVFSFLCAPEGTISDGKIYLCIFFYII